MEWSFNAIPMLLFPSGSVSYQVIDLDLDNIIEYEPDEGVSPHKASQLPSNGGHKYAINGK
jgi:hypothetical protein